MIRLLGILVASTVLSVPVLVLPANGAAGSVEHVVSADLPGSTAVVSGTVTSSVDGSPLEGVLVVFTGDITSDTPSGGGKYTDADGRFQIPVGFARGYRLRFTSTQTITHWYGGGETAASASIIDVGTSGIVDASVALDPAGVIRGTYSGSKPSSLLLMRATPGIGSGSLLRTIADGEFAVWITTEAPVTVGLRWATGVARFNGNKYHWRNSPALQVASGEELSGLAIDMPATATVTGRTTNVNDAVIAAKVRATIIEDGQRLDLGSSTVTDSDLKTGEFSLVVPATTLTLQAVAPNDKYGVGWLGGAPDAAGATALHPAEGQTLALPDLQLPGGRTINGVVSDTAGDPMAGVAVTAFAHGTDDVKGSAVSASDGTWSISGLGSSSMPDVNLRYDHPLLVRSWYPSKTYRSSLQTLDHLDRNHLSVADQTVSHLPQFRLAAAGAPVIEGTAIAGLEVSTSAVPVSPTPGTTRFLWLCDGVSLGLTGASVRLPATTAGCRLTVRQVSMLTGHQPAISESAPVTIVAPRATVRVAITGSRVSGAVLRATTPVWNFAADGRSHQWYRNGKPIAGATGGSYRLVTADVGDRLTVKVTARSTITGLMASTTSPMTGVVKARTVIRARWVRNREHLSAQLQVRVLTSGQSRPGGSITIRYPGRVYRSNVTRDLIRRDLYFGRRGWVTVRIDYLGSSRATPASTTLRVYMH
ncbi:hypothetical protein ASE01_08440 [Nocardioides sp. Root190]|uniref:hypothetical protein n=1 Tax=Nocardioides sp. Root190 TaxID=1736488 RepID=UPI00070090E2|nr:hypothetical protein [Nocardioides sp. Root190]KRB78172.1 hypothetical protein ASE01_08440 [Nocardioides sp. Root190]